MTPCLRPFTPDQRFPDIKHGCYAHEGEQCREGHDIADCPHRAQIPLDFPTRTPDHSRKETK